jgi:hypothetical protein
MSDLQRITSEYIEHEDRIRLTGAVEAGATEVLWLTQRLLIRVINHLLQWLEQQSTVAAPDALKDGEAAQLVQGFAQQAASAELQLQPPVQSKGDEQAWIVNSVDITRSPQAVKLNFKGARGELAALTLEARQLRQWLAIIHQLWKVAQWPPAIWPQWMQESSGPNTKQGADTGSDTAVH